MKINKCDFCEHSTKTMFGFKCGLGGCIRSQESIDNTMDKVSKYYKIKGEFEDG